ncbi:MAG: hypothetical protein QOH21_810, partial [Acidobacteriota bacterium]|nr:hypothetical protein [Acidobacteriota bacterium]
MLIRVPESPSELCASDTTATATASATA